MGLMFKLNLMSFDVSNDICFSSTLLNPAFTI